MGTITFNFELIPQVLVALSAILGTVVGLAATKCVGWKD